MKVIRWIIVVITIVGALIGARYATSHDASPSRPAAPPAPQVTAAQVIVRPIATANTYTGRLKAVDAVAVRPRVSGYITKVAFTEGAMVHKGQLLFQIDPRPYQAEVDRLKASLAAARSSLKLARANAKRGDLLIGKHYISRQQHDTLDNTANNAASNVAATRAELAAAELNLDFTHVRSPIDGRISNVRITPGNLVTSSDVLTEVVSENPLYAYFDVDENAYLALLDHGRAKADGNGTARHAEVLMGLSNESGFPHHGHVDFVDNRVDAGSGTIRLRAVFDNADGNLVPGLFARLRLPSGSPRPTVLIDPRAIGTDLGHRFVYVVDKTGKAVYQRIQPGPLFHGLRVVREGLKPGERIVIDGLQRVRPGQHVQAKLVHMDVHLSKRERHLVRSGGPLGGAAASAVANR
ncbi:MAG TPA: efflux RND transporter periplasmic adaptor subunit [Rhodanobacteraceae bacterium]